MRNIFLSLALVAISFATVIGSSTPINNLLVTKGVLVNTPVFNNVADVDNNSYKEFSIIKGLNFSPALVWPAANSTFAFQGKSLMYTSVQASNQIGEKNAGLNVYFVSTYINVDRFTVGNLKIKTNNMFVCFLDNDNVGNKDSFDDSEKSIELKLYTGKHRLTFVVLAKDSGLNFTPEFVVDEKYNESLIDNTVDPTHNFDILTELSGQKIKSSSISPSGKYILINYV